MGEKKYRDCIYIKDGSFMKQDSLGKYIVFDKVTKADVFKAIEMYLEANPNMLKTTTIIIEALKNAFGVSKCKHLKATIPESKEKVDDPLYLELVNYILTSKTYQKNFEDVIYIKDGELMKQRVNGEFFIFEEATKEDVFDAIENFLLTNPTEMKLSIIIKEAIKVACFVSKCRHCKITSKRQEQEILLDDPLYIEFVEFIRNSEVYQKRSQQAEEQRVKDRIQKEEIRKKKYHQNNLNGFFIDSVQSHHYRRYVR